MIYLNYILHCPTVYLCKFFNYDELREPVEGYITLLLSMQGGVYCKVLNAVLAVFAIEMNYYNIINAFICEAFTPCFYYMIITSSIYTQRNRDKATKILCTRNIDYIIFKLTNVVKSCFLNFTCPSTIIVSSQY